MNTISQLNRKVLLSFGLAISTLLTVDAISYGGMVASDESNQWVRHSYEVLDKLQGLDLAITNVESAYRGLTLTGNESYVDSYRASILSVQQDEASFRNLTVDNPKQQRQLPDLEALTAREIRSAELVIGLRRTRGLNAVADAREIGSNGRTVAAFLGVVRVLREEELRLLGLRDAEAKRRLGQTKTIEFLGTFLGLFIAAAAAWSAHSDSAARERAEQDLKRSNDLLTESNSELEAFNYTAAHDLRAPLRHIHGFVSLLHQGSYDKLDHEARHFLDKISTSSKEMGLLLDDLLNFSRLGRVDLQQNQVCLSQLVKRIQQELEPESRGRVLTWEIGELPEVLGDPTLLHQVLFNLISNAVKYTRKRDDARIEIGSRKDTGSSVTMFVRDNGAGFEMAYVDKLFRVFQRLHRSQDFEGTGIGLAIVRRIVERHGGRVWAEGVSGQGATFYFSLPNKTKEHHEGRSNE
jgi:signal transduction histidine kinase